MKQNLLWPARVVATDPSLINLSDPVTLETVKQSKHIAIVIDGLTHAGKNSAGILVAKALKANLVDSGRFYRAITKFALVFGVDVQNEFEVADFCQQLVVQVGFKYEEEHAPEAQVWLNGIFFPKHDLQAVSPVVSHVAKVHLVREFVAQALWRLQYFGDLVVLGRDIGSAVLPHVPLKYFLTASEAVREARHLATSGQTGAVLRDHLDRNQIVIPRDAVVIDTSELNPAEVRDIIMFDINSAWDNDI